jgi:hypothetical protein
MSFQQVFVPAIQRLVYSYLDVDSVIALMKCLPSPTYTISEIVPELKVSWLAPGHTHQTSETRLVRGKLLPIIMTDVLHSVKLSMIWRDKARDYHVKKFFVVACKKEDCENEVKFESKSNRVVHESKPSIGRWDEYECIWIPRSDEVYYIWYQVRHESRRTMRFKDMAMHYYVYDDSKRMTKRLHEKLADIGMLEIKQGVDAMCSGSLHYTVRDMCSRMKSGEALKEEEIASVLKPFEIEYTKSVIVLLDRILSGHVEWLEKMKYIKVVDNLAYVCDDEEDEDSYTYDDDSYGDSDYFDRYYDNDPYNRGHKFWLNYDSDNEVLWYEDDD